MRQQRVIGNWKMHGNLAANADLLAAMALGTGGLQTELAICVPFPYLAQASAVLAGSPVQWGAQDVSTHAQGAFTGDVSAAMLADFGCRYVLVGHSERRQWHAETDMAVAAKAAVALAGGITPVVCVGETSAERDTGQARAVVTRQLAAVLAGLGREAARAVVAYEPVWAIGTGRVASPAEAQEVHGWIRGQLTEAGAGNVSVLYGGSVKAANASGLFAEQDIDGALVGGASLDANEFLAIARAAHGGVDVTERVTS